VSAAGALLTDTDGSVSHTGPRGQGQCEYSSKDERLAREVLELIRSLGYRASIVVKPDMRSRTGEQWRVRFRSRPDCVPFLLPRKADRCVEAGEQHYTNRRSIVSIELVASVPVRCITVDTSGFLFLVGDGFLPTHSSPLGGAASPEPLVPDLQRPVGRDAGPGCGPRGRLDEFSRGRR
jgi:hypothetical protein